MVVEIIEAGLVEEVDLKNTLQKLTQYDPQDVSDAFWLVSLKLESFSEIGKNRFFDMVTSYSNSKEHLDVICSTLEIEMLGKCGLIDLNKAKTSLIRANTSQKYRQTKFNLIREESEGYAKILVEFLRENSVEVICRNTSALIGYFRLDPNRVFDLAIEALYLSEDRLCAVCNTLFISEDHSKLEGLVSFKLSRIHELTDAELRRTTFKGIGILLVRNFLNLNSISKHMNITHFKKSCRTRDVQILSKQPKSEEIEIITELLAATLTLPKGWEISFQLLNMMGSSVRHAFRNPDVSLGFLEFLQVELSYLYSSLFPNNLFSPVDASKPLQLRIQTIEDFGSKVCPLLSSFGPEATCSQNTKNTSLLIMIIRLVGSLSPLIEFEETVNQMLTLCILPSITLLPNASPIPMEEIWINIFKSMHFSRRFALYASWQSSIANSFRPELKLALDFARTESTASLKRFCADPVKNLFPSRKLAKVSSVNPFCAFDNLLKTCQVNVNLIPSVLSSFGFCTKLCLDVFIFVSCEALNSSKLKVQPDGNYATWFTSICRLIGKTFSDHPDMDILPLLELIFSRLSVKRDTSILRVLLEVVENARGVKEIADYDQNTLRSSGGGELLRYLSRLSAEEDPSKFNSNTRKRSLERLKINLEKMDLFAGFLVAIALRRKKMLFEDSKKIKTDDFLLSSSLLYDNCTSSFLEFSDYVACEISPKNLVASLPPFAHLVEHYGLDPVEAFHIWRLGRRNEESLDAFKADVLFIYPTKTKIELYSLFWQFSLFDISLPIEQYENEKKRLNDRKANLDRERRYTENQVEDLKKAVNSLTAALKGEIEIQKKRQIFSIKILKAQEFGVLNDDEMLYFFQDCLVPRMLLSHEDSFYCWKFVELAILPSENEASLLLIAFDLLIKILFSCTEKECQRVIIFLYEITSWCKSKLSIDRYIVYFHEGLLEILSSKHRLHIRHGLLLIDKIRKDIFSESQIKSLGETLKSVQVNADDSKILEKVKNELAKYVEKMNAPALIIEPISSKPSSLMKSDKTETVIAKLIPKSETKHYQEKPTFDAKKIDSNLVPLLSPTDNKSLKPVSSGKDIRPPIPLKEEVIPKLHTQITKPPLVKVPNTTLLSTKQIEPLTNTGSKPKVSDMKADDRRILELRRESDSQKQSSENKNQRDTTEFSREHKRDIDVRRLDRDRHEQRPESRRESIRGSLQDTSSRSTDDVRRMERNRVEKESQKTVPRRSRTNRSTQQVPQPQQRNRSKDTRKRNRDDDQEHYRDESKRNRANRI